MAALMLPGNQVSELDDLIRALARVFGNAQDTLEQRQDELLVELRPGAASALPLLRINLPDGTEAELSPLELCAPHRQRLEDMVVDLLCVVQEVDTPDGMRLGLRPTPPTQGRGGVHAVQISFSQRCPIRAELRFADAIIRSVPLSDAELPTTAQGEQTRRARHFLIDPQDAAQIRAHASIVYPAAHEESGQALSAHAGSPPSKTTVALPSTLDLNAASPEAAGLKVESPEAASTVTPATASVQPAVAYPRRAWLRRATPIVLGLSVLALLARPRPERSSPPDLSSAIQNVGDGETHAALVEDGGVYAAIDAAAPPADFAASPSADVVPQKVRFYYYDIDGITGITCDDRPVALRRNSSSGRSSGRALLKPGALCEAVGAGQPRVYTFEEMTNRSASIHVRLSPRLNHTR